MCSNRRISAAETFALGAAGTHRRSSGGANRWGFTSFCVAFSKAREDGPAMPPNAPQSSLTSLHCADPDRRIVVEDHLHHLSAALQVQDGRHKLLKFLLRIVIIKAIGSHSRALNVPGFCIAPIYWTFRTARLSSRNWI